MFVLSYVTHSPVVTSHRLTPTGPKSVSAVITRHGQGYFAKRSLFLCCGKVQMDSSLCLYLVIVTVRQQCHPEVYLEMTTLPNSD